MRAEFILYVHVHQIALPYSDAKEKIQPDRVMILRFQKNTIFDQTSGK